MTSERTQGTYDTRYDGIYQRGGSTDAPQQPAVPVRRTAPVSSGATHQQSRQDQYPERSQDPAEDSSIIREVGAEPVLEPEHPRLTRNPFDVWLWVISAVLVALGVFFVSAPTLYAEDVATTYYSSPWFNYTVMIAPPLILLGLATAVVQVFVLSVRHTLRTR
jgi:hypothetical protein